MQLAEFLRERRANFDAVAEPNRYSFFLTYNFSAVLRATTAEVRNMK